jgi:hypothetical protein
MTESATRIIYTCRRSFCYTCPFVPWDALTCPAKTNDTHMQGHSDTTDTHMHACSCTSPRNNCRSLAEGSAWTYCGKRGGQLQECPRITVAHPKGTDGIRQEDIPGHVCSWPPRLPQYVQADPSARLLHLFLGDSQLHACMRVSTVSEFCRMSLRPLHTVLQRQRVRPPVGGIEQSHAPLGTMTVPTLEYPLALHSDDGCPQDAVNDMIRVDTDAWLPGGTGVSSSRQPPSAPSECQTQPTKHCIGSVPFRAQNDTHPAIVYRFYIHKYRSSCVCI